MIEPAGGAELAEAAQVDRARLGLACGWRWPGDGWVNTHSWLVLVVLIGVLLSIANGLWFLGVFIDLRINLHNMHSFPDPTPVPCPLAIDRGRSCSPRGWQMLGLNFFPAGRAVSGFALAPPSQLAP
jgi:hypothetical protein